ncbi:MAG: hypothetical protein MR681_08805 [Prevotella sp.]|nr:hypothetical protein [Prevotella sp.]
MNTRQKSAYAKPQIKVVATGTGNILPAAEFPVARSGKTGDADAPVWED